MRHEGYLIIDHRASPGLIKGHPLFGEGRVYEAATQWCGHCGVCVVMNPERTRERYHCPKCTVYLCDGCAVGYKANHVCRPFAQVADELKSGKTATPVFARDLKGPQ